MQAVVFHAPFDLRVEDVPEPRLKEPDDVIVEVELAAICGSDLHPYRGREKGLDPGTVMGHEFVGKIRECGAGVKNFEVGERVVAPFSTSCGECHECRTGLTARCSQGQLFGWIEDGRGLHGGQAEQVRVPLADTTLARIPESANVEVSLFAGDILSTGLYAADLGGVGPGVTVAVVGCGPVGLMAVAASIARKAGLVLAIDPMPERRLLAEGFGARSLDPAVTVDGSLVDRLRALTGGRGADAALEMVGSPDATRLAVDSVRPGGTIAAVGVHTEAGFAFTPGEAYDKNLTYRAGRCPVRAYMKAALELTCQSGLDLDSIVTDRVPLSGAVEAYRKFDRREGGCVKVLLDPQAS